nr:MAG TPA: hypothetical protein [Caudoviricetes sp.]
MFCLTEYFKRFNGFSFYNESPFFNENFRIIHF